MPPAKQVDQLKSKAIRVTVPTPHGYKAFYWPRKVLIVGYGLADCAWDSRKGEYKALSQFAVCCARTFCAVFHLLLPSVCDFISFLLFCRPALHAVVLLALGGCLDEHLSIGRPGPRQQSLGDPLELPPEEPNWIWRVRSMLQRVRCRSDV